MHRLHGDMLTVSRARNSCSAACSKVHRENHPPPDETRPQQQEQKSNSAAPAEPAHPFSVLDDSAELRQLFARYPKLPARLQRIHEATLPPKDDDGMAAKSAGGLPWKLDGRGRHQRRQPWTHDVGLQRGQMALRDARTDPGEDGDAVREYCALVLHLLNKEATAVVRSAVAAQDAKLIEQLMQSEMERQGP